LGSFTLATLEPGWVYYGPAGIDDADLCKCNTVLYSLLSACGGCQGDSWMTWSEYTFNCSKILPPSTFPNPVPAGTRVPRWAVLDVTLENSWDPTKSMATGDSPEIASGALIGNPGSTTTAASPNTPTGSPTDTSSVDPFTSLPPLPSSISVSFGNNLNVGAVVGGSVGGITVIAITIFGIFYMRRQRRPMAPSAAFVIDVDDSSHPHEDEVKPLSDGGTPAPSSTASAPLTPMRLYDPDDPTTFPGYQAALLSPEVVNQTTFSPYSASVDTSPTTHSSGPPGYHGLPTV